MDDDAPLCALAKAPRFDDDTPLAALGKPKLSAGSAGATKGRPAKPAKPSAPDGAPKPPKAAGAEKVKKKKAESSSSSSGSSSSSSSSSKKGKAKKKAGAKKSGAKGAKAPKTKKSGSPEAAGDEDEDGEENHAPVKKRNRGAKEDAVAQLLCRWWYVLPDWPPTEESFYRPLLDEKKLRKVAIDQWEWVPDLDDRGFKKVYELTQFRGLFRTVEGDLLDLRPKETCPCLSTFMKKDLPDIYDLLVKAYEAQYKALEESKYNETKLQMDIKNKLTNVRDSLHKANAVRSTKR